VKLHPLSWILTTCPDHETPYLYNYEFSRESARLRKWVKFVRMGKIKAPTYWTPNPEFGWLQWPLLPYLSISAEDRARLLETIFRQRTSASELMNLRAQLFQREGPKLPEIFSALLRLPLDPTQNQAVGRAAIKAKHNNELRGLAVYRLREHYPAQVARRMYNNIYGQTYGDADALEKAKRKARRYLTAFVLKAAANASQGLWFPPFGPSLITPS
jgi:hypothetical protein